MSKNGIINFISEPKNWEDENLFDPFIPNLARYNPVIVNGAAARKSLEEQFSLSRQATFESSEVGEILNEINDAVALIEEDFGALDTKIYLFEMDGADEFVKNKMNGVSGYSNSPNEMFVCVQKSSNWRGFVNHTTVHELTHCHRYKYSDPYLRFIDWLVLEGLAEVYLNRKRNLQSAWTVSADKETIRGILPEVASWWKNEGMTPEAPAYFFGSEELKIPLWFGYSLGYWIVDDFVKGAPDLSWAELLKKPSDEFVDAFSAKQVKSCFLRHSI